MIKKRLCCIVFLMLLALCRPILAEEFFTLTGMVRCEVSSPAGLSDQDALQGYIDRAFGLRDQIGIVTRDASLTGLNLEIYNQLVLKIKQVASGELSSTVFDITVDSDTSSLSYTKDELGLESFDDPDLDEAYFAKAGFSLKTVFNALLVNLPYDLYWYDKTGGFSYSYWFYPDDQGNPERVTFFNNGHMNLDMKVSKDYSVTREIKTTDFDTDLADAISSAAENAQKIIRSHTGETDLQKLQGYKTAICGMVSYNDSAANNSSTPYGNPWQLVWVFDGDPGTNVVCEGYSKAFKYLCDQSRSSFSNSSLSVSIVNGFMSGGTGEGRHMWNLVNMGNGKNYLVDVTNCDEGTVGYPDKLFLAGSNRIGTLNINGVNKEGYVFSANGTDVIYVYSDDIIDLYSDIDLAVADSNYSGENEPQIAATGVCGVNGDNLTWSLYDDGSLIISGTGDMNHYESDTNPAPWQEYQTAINKVILQDGVTSIGNAAFNNCSSLTDIFLPNSMLEIGDSAFFNCISMKNISIPDEVSYLGENAFAGCDQLNVFYHPGSLFDETVFDLMYNFNPAFVWKVTENGTLSGIMCPSNVSRVTIPECVKTIGSFSFAGYNDFTEVIIPGSVIVIEDNAFGECSGLTSMIIPDSVTYIGDYAFMYCSGLTSVTLPNQLTSIGVDVFCGCRSLADITIPNSVTDIGEGAFAECNSLISILIPDNVISIGDNAFSGCSRLTEIQVSSNNEYFCSEEGILFNKDKTELVIYPGGKEESFYIIPDSVQSIADASFRSCSNLTGVVIPDGVNQIGDYAFSYNLTEIFYTGSFHQWELISIGEFNETLDEIIIHYHYGLPVPEQNLILPACLSTIESEAFTGLFPGAVVYIPGTVNFISDDAFGKDIVIVTPLNSSAADWARRNQIDCYEE